MTQLLTAPPLLALPSRSAVTGTVSLVVRPSAGPAVGVRRTHSLLRAPQILATEIGDETFIVAALMAMRYPKATVFGGAISALVVMTIISTALGYVVPSLISKRATGIGAGILYTFFGLRLLYIAYRLKPNETCEVRLHTPITVLPPTSLPRTLAAHMHQPPCPPLRGAVSPKGESRRRL